MSDPLTATEVAALTDANLTFTVFHHVCHRVAEDGAGGEVTPERLERLPEPLQFVFATAAVEMEVANGGFNQFFWNHGTALIDLARRGFLAFGAPRLAQLVVDAAEQYKKEQADRPESDKPEDVDGLLKDFSESYRDSALWTEDRAFYEVRRAENPDAGRAAYLRAQPDLAELNRLERCADDWRVCSLMTRTITRWKTRRRRLADLQLADSNADSLEDDVPPSYDEWFTATFDQPAEEHIYEFYSDVYMPPHLLCIDYLTRTFENAGALLIPFSDKQLGQALWRIPSGQLGGEAMAVYEDEVPLEHKIRFAKSILILFRDLFAVRCFDTLTAWSESASWLNDACYMWWDNFPTWGSNIPEALAAELLDTMEQTLTLPCYACKESALHGLGHWHINHPNEVERIVDDFLAANGHLLPKLLDYARDARVGHVQ